MRGRRVGEEGFWLKERFRRRGVMVMRVGEGGFGNAVVDGVGVGGAGCGRIGEKESFCAMECDAVISVSKSNQI